MPAAEIRQLEIRSRLLRTPLISRVQYRYAILDQLLQEQFP
jgi:hypothetical protein